MKFEQMSTRLKRRSRIVCGVASMMADKFAWSCFWTRVVWAVAIVLNPAMGLLVYFVLALLLPKWDSQY